MIFSVSVLFIAAMVLLLRTDSIEAFLIGSTGITWFVGYLIPRLTFFLVLLTLAAGISFTVSTRPIIRALIFVVTVGLGTALYFLKNTPYKVDWNKYGSHILEDPDAVPFEKYFEKTNPNFEGVACLALSGCDYCHKTIDDLIKMKIRKPELDVAIFLFAIDSSEIELVRNQIGEIDISVQNAPDPDVSFRITYGNFPTVLFIKQGNVEHRWYYDEFGHPAKDLVESGAF